MSYYLDTLKDSLSRPSGLSNVVRVVLKEAQSILFTSQRGVDTDSDKLVAQDTDHASPKLEVQHTTDGQTILVNIGEPERTPEGKLITTEADAQPGTTRSRVAKTDQLRADKKTNNNIRAAALAENGILTASSNLATPVVSAAKYYLGSAAPYVIPNPLTTLSDVLYRLNTPATVAQATIPPITSPTKSTGGITSFIANAQKAFNDFMASRTTTTSQAVVQAPSSKQKSYTQAAYPQSFIAESPRQEFSYKIQEQQAMRAEVEKVAEQKAWEQNQQATKALEPVKAPVTTSIAGSQKAKNKNPNNLDSYLLSLAEMSGIDLSTVKGIDARHLSSMLLKRGTNPFLMMTLFEKMGNNFLSTYSLLAKSGNQHLFGEAIAKGLDASSTAVADNFARDLNSRSFMA